MMLIGVQNTFVLPLVTWLMPLQSHYIHNAASDGFYLNLPTYFLTSSGHAYPYSTTFSFGLMTLLLQ